MDASITLSCGICGPLLAFWNEEKKRREVRRGGDRRRNMMRQCTEVKPAVYAK